MFSIAKVDEASDHLEKVSSRAQSGDLDDVERLAAVNRAVGKLPVLSLDRGAFHIDVPAAVASVASRHGQFWKGTSGRRHGSTSPLKEEVQAYDSKSLED